MKRSLLAILFGVLAGFSFGQTVVYDTIITIQVLDRMIYDTTIIARSVDASVVPEISEVTPVPSTGDASHESGNQKPETVPVEVVVPGSEMITDPANEINVAGNEVPVSSEGSKPGEEIATRPAEELPKDPANIEPSIEEIETEEPKVPHTPEVAEKPDEVVEEMVDEVVEEVVTDVAVVTEIEEELDLPDIVEEPEPVEETVADTKIEEETPEPMTPVTIDEEIAEEGTAWKPVVDISSRMAESISEADLREYVSVLASDEFEGRETGTLGQKKAARYIARKFHEFGLEPLTEEPTFFQEVPLINESWEDVGLSVNGIDYEYMKDFYCFPKSNRSRALTEVNNVIFLGYGIDDEMYSDYEKVNVQDKIILIYQGEPMDKDSISYITGTKDYSEWALNWQKKLKVARKYGVKAVLFIERNVPFYVARYAFRLTNPYIRLTEKDPAKEFANSVYISTDVAREIIGKKFNKVVRARDKIRDTGKPHFVDLDSKVEVRQKELKVDVNGDNVIGVVKGSDPELEEEHIIITAHFDHLGKKGDEIFNGADDNASGTSAVMEIAQAFAKAKEQGAGPNRSIVFMAVSGEEKGLLGSEHYADNPLVPLNKAVANLNIDMIGRYDEAHEGDYDYIYVIGADRLSTTLHDINERMNQNYLNLKLDYTFNAEDDPNRFYYRSDHYNFAEKGIPAAFFFSGTHEDYHRVSDTMDKLNYKRMQRVARLVFHTAWELANRDERIQINVDLEEK